jgi:diguanylate cyclase (GGDEF)-like protein
VLLPQTYRARLLLYTTLLIVFLISVLFYFFAQSREAILGAANRNTGLFAAEIEAKVRLEREELNQSAHLISNNGQLRQYLFVVVSINAAKKPLEKLFRREFGWLAFDRAIIIGRTGRILYGPRDSVLMGILKGHGLGSRPVNRTFFYSDRNGIQAAAAVPVYYQKGYLGEVILTRTVDQGLIDAARKAGYGQIFVVRDGRIVRSSLDVHLRGRRFVVHGGLAKVGSEKFIVQQVRIGEAAHGRAQIWFGFSDPELMNRLRDNRNEMLLLASGGSLAILLVGLMMLRSFTRPIGRLVKLMREVREGRLPDMDIISAPDRDEMGYLTNQFRSMVRRLRENQAEVEHAQAQLEQQATTDALTGLYNRRYLYDVFPKLQGEAERQGNTLTVIILDLDYFKQVNDLCGHLVGDRVLAHIAQILTDCCRVSDFVFRLGGEEFLILTSGDTGGGEILAEKIRSRIEKSPMEHEGQEIAVTGSFGVARVEARDGGDGLRAALTRADKALYAAKHSGRNRVALWDLRQVNG